MQSRFKFLTNCSSVIDLGAAPGSWCQVVANHMNSLNVKKYRIIGVDVKDIDPVDGVTMLNRCSVLDDDIEVRVRKALLPFQSADVVLSDMAPNATGIRSVDHARIMELVQSAFDFADRLLYPNKGIFICKIWDGREVRDLKKMLREKFDTVKDCRPPASRKDSTEFYVICKRFRRHDVPGS